MMFTREAFLAGPRPKVEQVQIEGHPEPICIRAMNVGEMERFQKFLAGEPAPLQSEITARFVMGGVCDEGGNLLLSEGDLDAIKELEPGYLMKVQDAVIRINKLDKETVEAEEKKG